MRRATRAVCALLLGGCIDSTGPPFPQIELTDFAPSLGIDLSEMTRIQGGIYVLDLAEGSGATIGLTPNEYVEVSYSSYLADGTLLEQAEDYNYQAGCSQVVPRGLGPGVTGMKVGGQRRIIIPGRWGYGSDPPQGIYVPFGAIVVFVVDALGTRPSSGDCTPPR